MHFEFDGILDGFMIVETAKWQLPSGFQFKWIQYQISTSCSMLYQIFKISQPCLKSVSNSWQKKVHTCNTKTRTPFSIDVFTSFRVWKSPCKITNTLQCHFYLIQNKNSVTIRNTTIAIIDISNPYNLKNLIEFLLYANRTLGKPNILWQNDFFL